MAVKQGKKYSPSVKAGTLHIQPTTPLCKYKGRVLNGELKRVKF